MKVVFVSGGSKGIGLASVLRFVELGYQVVTCSREPAVWGDVLSQHPELHAVDYVQADLSKEEAVSQLFVYIEKQYGKLDIAINNASPLLASKGRFESVSVDALKETMLNDYWSYALCLKYELALMSAGASVVNISSVNGLRPTPNAAMYSSAKHGLEGLTRSVALEAIEKGVRVNGVAPGVTWTPRWQERQRETPRIKEEVADVVPIKRFAEAEEIVGAIEFLSSDKANYIVGHTLVVDGGISLV
ncbi:Levodione reductase [Marinomonas spartinae]|uniref:Levodione reductase n=1 Tax=Marinomonas spartinae TaxID=1792290 RepID=A0A1A8TJE3_9GAMM|nr:SDR family oxidoreductase [Marinomonas spartinae]SBS32648.1 Levodione reductase [Marinomonas spartinae]